MSCSITLKSLKFPKGEKTLFHNVNLSVGHKEKVAVIGPNGCGKSTLLKIIAGLQSGFEGTLELFHRPVRTPKEYKPFRDDVGYLPQDVSEHFLCPTVIEDVMFGLRARGSTEEAAHKRALQMLDSLGIFHLRNRSVFELSGGEQKIAALAGILILEPKILLLDEPTNALDDQAQQRVLKLLQSIEKSMVIISHHREFIEGLTPTVYTLRNKGLHPL